MSSYEEGVIQEDLYIFRELQLDPVLVFQKEKARLGFKKIFLNRVLNILKSFFSDLIIESKHLHENLFCINDPEAIAPVSIRSQEFRTLKGYQSPALFQFLPDYLRDLLIDLFKDI